MSSIMLKSEKASSIANVIRFLYVCINGMGEEIGSQSWFPNSIAGLQITVPILPAGKGTTRLKSPGKPRKSKNHKRDGLPISFFFRKSS